MLAHTISLWHIWKDDIALLHKIDQVFTLIPERNFVDLNWRTIPISCHHISHALWKIFTEFETVDGWFWNRGWEHSWLEKRTWQKEIVFDREFEDIIILDPYPICGFRPQMYFWYSRWPWKNLYMPLSWKLRESLAWWLLCDRLFEQQVEQVKADIIDVLKKI